MYAGFTSFEVIPAMYPKKIRYKNDKLLPFVVLALYDLITFKGHEIPKLTIMAISNNSGSCDN